LGVRERHTDRESARQIDRETERQRDRIERQRNKEKNIIETQRNKEFFEYHIKPFSQENGHNTFHVYFLLLQAIMLAVNGQKNYVVQYNEETAW
jgi:hypothetical protein